MSSFSNNLGPPTSPMWGTNIGSDNSASWYIAFPSKIPWSPVSKGECAVYSLRMRARWSTVRCHESGIVTPLHRRLPESVRFVVSEHSPADASKVARRQWTSSRNRPGAFVFGERFCTSSFLYVIYLSVTSHSVHWFTTQQDTTRAGGRALTRYITKDPATRAGLGAGNGGRG